ncbi:MAG TPA: NADP-dependent oxidoreductase [Candidatus Binataceae bacterium]|nr:NADP-dependent oxidoreductase [Candidatus Binataceae bacterium]
MAELKNRQWLLASRPVGMIKETDFRWNETTILPLKEGEVLLRNLVLSCDPTQRGWMAMDTYVPAIPLGNVMRAVAVSEVLESRKSGFASGDLVQGMAGWEDYTVSDGQGMFSMQKLALGTDPQLALSVLGLTGLTAYFGVLDIGLPKQTETFVVSGAAGATGSVAGMIAKIKGCRVIGIAGGPAKCSWLVNEAGFDGVIDYKSEDVGSALSHICHKGIDIYFDNVGGEILEKVMDRIRDSARVVLCGGISQYNNPQGMSGSGPRNYFNLILRNARMEGFIVLKFAKRFPEAVAELAKWHSEGKIKNQLDVVSGLENAPKALIRLFTGANLGKQLLQLSNPG